MIELAPFIQELRRELLHAVHAADREWLQFVLGPVELELTVGVQQTTGASASLKFFVLEMGGDVDRVHSSTQRLKITLQPALRDTGLPPRVSGPSVPGER